MNFKFNTDNYRVFEFANEDGSKVWITEEGKVGMQIPSGFACTVPILAWMSPFIAKTAEVPAYRT